MMFIADGYEPLTTALYFEGDPYLVRAFLSHLIRRWIDV